MGNALACDAAERNVSDTAGAATPTDPIRAVSDTP